MILEPKRGAFFDLRLKWMNGSEHEGMDKQSKP